MKELQEAFTAVRAGDHGQALEFLLTAWRRQRAPELADLIDRLSPLAAEKAPKVEGKRQRDKQTRWIALAESRKTNVLHGLLGSLGAVHTKLGYQRVLALIDFPADPRIARALVKLFQELPFQSKGTFGYWNMVFDRIVENAEPRATELLRGLVGKSMERTRSAESTAFFEPALAEVMGRLDRVKVPARLSLAEQKLVASLDQAIVTPPPKPVPAAVQDLAALLEAVYQDPDSDDRRRVLGDALQQAGDPRGEFIALQLERARLEEQGRKVAAKHLEREAKLLKKHFKEWIGKLTPILEYESLVFEKGFLRTCTARYVPYPNKKTGVALQQAIGAAEWSTVQRLEQSEVTLPEVLLGGPILRSLKVASPIGLGFARQLLKGKQPLRFEELAFQSGGRKLSLTPLLEATTIPHLRRLDLDLAGPPEAYVPVFGSTLGRQLQVLRVGLWGRPVQEWLTLLAKVKEPIPELRLNTGEADLALTRDEGGRWSVIDVHLLEIRGNGDYRMWGVGSALAGLPPDALTRFRVHGKGASHPSVKVALDLQTQLVERVIPR